jgi:CDP-paratose 2-epimerase
MLVTGSSGLIGSEVVAYFATSGWDVHGIDNNMRSSFFGPGGDTRWNQQRLLSLHQRFTHHELDIRERQGVLDLVHELRPEAICHTAAQPSHELAARRPFDDFDVNAVGTLNLLEAARRHVPESPFVFLSTNKVYGDAPNELPFVELDRRWDFARETDRDGVREDMRIDQSTHSLFGSSKLAADVLTQEYGRYFSLPTCCLRAGCLTGPNHAGVELHGFLSYLIKVNIERRRYKIFGYKGKQVRDNLHSYDVARFVEEFIAAPRPGEVYNIGGGRKNSCSILEAFERTEALTGLRMDHEYVDDHRTGDHICYISDLSKIVSHYPAWSVTKTLDDIFEEIVESWSARQKQLG